MIRNFTGDTEDITTPAGHAQVARLLDHINTLLVEAQEATGHLYNLEATPAEGATYRFAREDIARYPGIIHAGTADEPYYTNSTPTPPSPTPLTPLTRWPNKTTCRPNTPAVPSSICIWGPP